MDGRHRRRPNGAPPTGSTDQGALSTVFYNVQQGDAPVFDYLARNFSMSDNYHQAVMGGTGTNHVALGTGTGASYQDANGDPQTPPANQIENPNAQPRTNNFYTQDGYSGGTYSRCADPSQPGVGAVLDYLHQQWPSAASGCAPDTYYMLNNYNPGYLANGTKDPGPFAVPPQSESTFPTIGDELSSRDVSWGYFGQGWNAGNPNLAQYCNICNPFQYATSIMTNPAQRKAHLHGFGAFQRAAAAGTLPSVSIVKPEGTFDGHPAYSTLAAFESFASTVIGDVAKNPKLWRSTAIFVTMDEGGGYYDSGYIQPTSFFGDGTRVPMIAISPWVNPGRIDHTYADHVSVLKFIEANWRLQPLSSISLDNLPNPIARKGDPYVPVNGPGDRQPDEPVRLPPLIGPDRSRTHVAAADDRGAHNAPVRTGDGDSARLTRPRLAVLDAEKNHQIAATSQQLCRIGRVRVVRRSRHVPSDVSDFGRTPVSTLTPAAEARDDAGARMRQSSNLESEIPCLY